MDVRLSNGRVVSLTEAQLDAGVALRTDDGVHHVARREGRIEDRFEPEVAASAAGALGAPGSRGAPIAAGGIGRSALPRAVEPNAAVEAAKTLIGGLERQIVRIENDNFLRTREIDQLLAQIATRRQRSPTPTRTSAASASWARSSGRRWSASPA